MVLRASDPAAETPPEGNALTRLPVSVLLHNVRSLYNVGAFLRTGDAVGLSKLCLSAPNFPVLVVFGHEVEGLPAEIVERCDTRVRIPMVGTKRSLNVATAGGVVLYEVFRKYRLNSR